MLFTQIISVLLTQATASIIPCNLVDEVADYIFPAEDVTTKAGCSAADTAVSAACELITGTAIEPIANFCAVALSAEFEQACVAALESAGSFTANALKSAVGCSDLAARMDALSTDLESIVPCWAVDDVCSTVIGATGKIVSQAACVAGDASVAAACEVILGSPLDPLADACAFALAAAFETACTVAINQVGGFGISQCESTLGCSASLEKPAPVAVPAALETTIGLYGLGCESFYNPLIAKQFPNGVITTQAQCTAAKNMVAPACQNAGFDYFTAQACAAGLPTQFETWCAGSVAMYGAYTAQAVKLGLGCANTNELAAPPSRVLRAVNFE